jgi:hypothetical protein
MKILGKYFLILYKEFWHPWILVSMGDPGTNSLQLPRDNYLLEHDIRDAFV